ncbi:MAG: hypothetical protein AAGA36_00440 [Pseudomonadota bacterium]
MDRTATVERNRDPRTEPLEPCLELYWEKHACHIPGRDMVQRGLRHFAAFTAIEQKAGRLPADLRLGVIDGILLHDFMKWLSVPHSYRYPDANGEIKTHDNKEGYSAASRDTFASHIAACANWHYKNSRSAENYLVTYKSPKRPKGKNAKKASAGIDQVAKILEAGWKVSEQAGCRHIMISIMLHLAAAVRPWASFDMHSSWCIDRDRFLLHTLAPDRDQRKKVRGTKPLPLILAHWIWEVDGYLLSKPHKGEQYGDRKITSLKNRYREVSDIVGAPVHAKRLRMICSQALKDYGIEKSLRDGFTDHADSDTTDESYSGYDPDFNGPEREAIDAYFDRLSAFTDVHLRYQCDTRLTGPSIIRLRNWRANA